MTNKEQLDIFTSPTRKQYYSSDSSNERKYWKGKMEGQDEGWKEAMKSKLVVELYQNASYLRAAFTTLCENAKQDPSTFPDWANLGKTLDAFHKQTTDLMK